MYTGANHVLITGTVVLYVLIANLGMSSWCMVGKLRVFEGQSWQW